MKKLIVKRVLLLVLFGLGIGLFSFPNQLFAAQATTQQNEVSDFQPVGLGLGRMNSGSNMQAVIAEALKMTTQELYQARQSGKSVAELAKEKGVNLDDLKEKILAKRNAQLTELVKKGTITKEQQTQKLEQIKANINYQLNNKAIRGKGTKGQRCPRQSR